MSHDPQPEYSSRLQSLTRSGNRLVFICALVLASLSLLAAPTLAHADGSLSLGSVTNQNAAACSGDEWVSYSSHGTTYNMTCASATLSGCRNVQDVNFTYGQLIPPGTVNGVVVFLDGGGGTTAALETDEYDMLQYYFAQGYGVVQIAWNSDWEQTPDANIQNAACRPATFLNYVYNNIYEPLTDGRHGNSSAGMCAQGFSAGSAAIGYSLAYYGAGDYLDNVELLSGPVLSDLKQGCEVPQASPVTVCPDGQYGCRMGDDKPWTLSPGYVPFDAGMVRSWTDDNSCQGSIRTSDESNAAWLAESIVDDNTGAAPTFNYPDTSMSGWLCRSLRNLASDCATNPNDYQNCPNNSSTQGQLFYKNITRDIAPPVFNVYSVDGCEGPEGVSAGTVDALSVRGQAPQGEVAIENDMTAQCFHSRFR